MSLICEMKAYAEREGLPILRDSEVPLFERIIANQRPVKVLEIGTCIGYSALRMAPFLGDGGTITTIEFDEGRWQKARDFIGRSPYKGVITALLGDGTELSGSLSGPWDLVFSTGPKDSMSASFGSSCRNFYPGPLSWPTTSAIMRCFISKAPCPTNTGRP